MVLCPNSILWPGDRDRPRPRPRPVDRHSLGRRCRDKGGVGSAGARARGRGGRGQRTTITRDNDFHLGTTVALLFPSLPRVNPCLWPRFCPVCPELSCWVSLHTRTVKRRILSHGEQECAQLCTLALRAVRGSQAQHRFFSSVAYSLRSLRQNALTHVQFISSRFPANKLPSH